MLLKILSKARNTKVPKRFNGAPCAYFDGILNYFNLNKDAFHSKKSEWNGPCVNKSLFRMKILIILSIWLGQCNHIEFCFPGFPLKTTRLYFIMEIGMMLFPIMIPSRPSNSFTYQSPTSSINSFTQRSMVH